MSVVWPRTVSGLMSRKKELSDKNFLSKHKFVLTHLSFQGYIGEEVCVGRRDSCGTCCHDVNNVD